MSFSLSGRDGDSNRLHLAGQSQTHPYESTLARMGHRSLHSAVSLDRFAKLMILYPHMNCPKPEARRKHGLGPVPFLQAPLPAMLTVQYTRPE